MPSCRVYVGGLPYRCTDRDLEDFFRGYGRIREVLIKNGYGFVEFDDNRDADDAVYELDGKKFMGSRLSVEMARGTPRGRDRDHWTRRSGGGANNYTQPYTRTNHRLIVKNLSTRVSWQDLKDLMRGAGEVTYADAHKDRRNEGVVEFATHGDMKEALDRFNGKDLHGRRIDLIEDGKLSGSRSGRSSSRSRSRSRSRR